jgi:hypothetical protein
MRNGAAQCGAQGRTTNAQRPDYGHGLRVCPIMGDPDASSQLSYGATSYVRWSSCTAQADRLDPVLTTPPSRLSAVSLCCNIQLSAKATQQTF